MKKNSQSLKYNLINNQKNSQSIIEMIDTSIHHRINHYSEKKMRQKKILEAKFEARPKFGLRPEQRPKMRPGQLWGQATPMGPGRVLQYAVPVTWKNIQIMSNQRPMILGHFSSYSCTWRRHFGVGKTPHQVILKFFRLILKGFKSLY